MNKRVVNRRLKRNFRVVVFIIMIFLIIADFYLINKTFNFDQKNTSELLYAYRVKQNLDYKVMLYPNSFIENEYLGKNESYISDLVKSIEVIFNYNYSGSKKTDLEYKYNINAEIYGEYKLNDENQTSKVWTKNFEIENKSNIIKDASGIVLNPKVNIDYNYYNEIVSEFRKKLKLPISAKLMVTFTADVNGEIENEKIKDKRNIIIEIPLNQQAFKIEEKYLEDESKYINTEKNQIKKFDYKNIIIFSIVQIIILTVFIFLLKLVLNVKPKSKYEQTRDKYLKEYGDIIVEINNKVYDDNLQFIEVKSFKELVDLEEELRIPINFYEDSNGLIGYFTIIHSDFLYYYIISNDSI